MSTVLIANLFGFAAATAGIVMFMPQAWQIFKTKNTKSISLVSFSLCAASSVCWLVYAALLLAAPVLLVNIFILALSLYIVMMKLKYK
jgi:MtN3 and saliva related transmembrane protein